MCLNGACPCSNSSKARLPRQKHLTNPNERVKRQKVLSKYLHELMSPRIVAQRSRNDDSGSGLATALPEQRGSE